MVAVLKPTVTDEQVKNLTAWLEGRGLTVHISKGESYTILGLIGDTSKIDTELLEGLEMVDSVKRISEPFKSANRKFHPDDTVVEVGGVRIGGPHFCVMAGPCSVESPEQILSIAESVRASGAAVLRGGAFKPRTSPYDFQGLRADGIELLLEAKRRTGMPIITEIMNAAHLPMFEQVDIIQVGARNMQNFELLKELGALDKPVMLKRGLANTLQELLMSAEYIMAGGNRNVILCERGIRTFETFTRNTLDISAIPALRELTHLPVVVDPSHATGAARFVLPMAMASAAAGAHGLLIEVHNDPKNALCDGAQSLTPEQFAAVTEKVGKIRQAML
ncbi:MAG: 3-deoxy-7-phosphoheptulonate synthase [Oscillospiraceae bacterium]|jgi:3-deoxy-7-phosphoheptulonate synthase|nr:3-deoxy-7-phosphoheptulonate synthase [Oscillospiraceae bacterium]